MTALMEAVNSIFGAPPVGKEHYAYIAGVIIFTLFMLFLGMVARRVFK
jgi:hypothetical protein